MAGRIKSAALRSDPLVDYWMAVPTLKSLLASRNSSLKILDSA